MEIRFQSFADFFTAMKNAQYAFLYLEPILTYGLAFGIFLFIFASIVKEQKCQVLGLALLIASCMMISPYVNKRLVAQKGVETIFAIDNPDRAVSFKEATMSRRGSKWLYYVTATLAVICLLFGIGKTKMGAWISTATVVFGLVTIFYGSLIHLQESQLYHPNINSEPSAVPGPQPYLEDGPPSWANRP